MKIAMVSEHASPLAAVGGVDAGGQNVHVAALSCALARKGVEVVVHTRRDDAGLPRRVRLAPGVNVDHVPAGPAQPIPKDELLPHMGAFAAQLRREWRRRPPDVVHAHFWMSGLAALHAAEGLNIPVVQTFHALGVVKRRHQGDRDTSPPERLDVEAMLAHRAHHLVVTCSDELFELVGLGADPKRMSIVPCGVDLSRFRPDGPSWWPPFTGRNGVGAGRLLAVGRLVERKGVDDVITALANVPGAQLVVAGGPPLEGLAVDPDASRLVRRARDCGVADRVRLIGRVDHRVLPALLRAADAVVCTPWYEPFGIVPVEAMACGIPVVVAQVGGLTDTVIHDVTGLHVPPRDPASLAAALRGLLADSGLRARLAQAGQDRSRARYPWSRVAAATLDAYAVATGARPSRSIGLVRRGAGSGSGGVGAEPGGVG